jgi:hypothetical protein
MKNGVTLLFVLIILAGLFMANTSPVKAQSTNIYINPDGAVVGTNNIQRNGDLYTLTGNISGGIQIQKSDIVIDGTGYTLQGNGGTGIDLTNNVTQIPSASAIWNVTVENLRIMNFNFSVETNGGGNDTFHDDYVAPQTPSEGVSFFGVPMAVTLIIVRLAAHPQSTWILFQAVIT